MRPRPERPRRRRLLGAADGRDLDPEVVVPQDLLRRLAPECHSLGAPLRHSNTMPVPLAGEDEARGKLVLPSEDSKGSRRAVGVADVHGEYAIHGRAEKVQLPDAFGVRALDELGLLGMRRHGEERAAKAEEVTRPILADIAGAARSDDLRGEHAARAGQPSVVTPRRRSAIVAAR